MTKKRYIIAKRSGEFYFTSLFIYDSKELLSASFKAMVHSRIEFIAKHGKKPMVAMTDKCAIAVWPEGEFDSFNRDDLKIVEYRPLVKYAKEYWD